MIKPPGVRSLYFLNRKREGSFQIWSLLLWGLNAGKATARVLFDGTHGLCVDSRMRLRDQERAPIAADLKRAMREKAKPTSSPSH